MSDHHGQDRPRHTDRVEEQEQGDAEDDVGDHQRAEKQRGNGGLPPEAATRERHRREQPEHDCPRAGEGRDNPARLERAFEVRVREELVVPVESEPGERERRHLRVVEREDQQDDDRRVEKHDDEGEEGPQQPRTVLRQRDVHQSSVTSPGWRKRAKTTVRIATTPRRKIASTEPVSQSGKPVLNRSTIWFPYM